MPTSSEAIAAAADFRRVPCVVREMTVSPSSGGVEGARIRFAAEVANESCPRVVQPGRSLLNGVSLSTLVGPVVVAALYVRLNARRDDTGG